MSQVSHPQSHSSMSSDSSCESLPLVSLVSLVPSVLSATSATCASPSDHDDHKKTKVELCRNYVQNGYCVYGDRCCFAHGYHELYMNASIGLKLRTKQCRLFHKDMVCKYGSRCNFIHMDRNANPVRVQNYEQTVNIITDYPELLLVRRKRRSILHGVVEFDC